MTSIQSNRVVHANEKQCCQSGSTWWRLLQSTHTKTHAANLNHDKEAKEGNNRAGSRVLVLYPCSTFNISSAHTGHLLLTWLTSTTSSLQSPGCRELDSQAISGSRGTDKSIHFLFFPCAICIASARCRVSFLCFFSPDFVSPSGQEQLLKGLIFGLTFSYVVSTVQSLLTA